MSVRIEKSGSVWTVIHSRPEARNAMDAASADALVAAFEQFDRDVSANVAVFWGEGGDVVDAVCAHGSYRRPACRGQPHPSRQRARSAVARQRGNRRHVVGDAAHASAPCSTFSQDGRLPAHLRTTVFVTWGAVAGRRNRADDVIPAGVR